MWTLPGGSIVKITLMVAIFQNISAFPESEPSASCPNPNSLSKKFRAIGEGAKLMWSHFKEFLKDDETRYNNQTVAQVMTENEQLRDQVDESLKKIEVLRKKCSEESHEGKSIPDTKEMMKELDDLQKMLKHINEVPKSNVTQNSTMERSVTDDDFSKLIEDAKKVAEVAKKIFSALQILIALFP